MVEIFDGIQPHIEHHDDDALVEDFTRRNSSHADDYDYDYDADHGYDAMDYGSDLSSQYDAPIGYGKPLFALPKPGKEKVLNAPTKRKRGRPRKICDPNTSIDAKGKHSFFYTLISSIYTFLEIESRTSLDPTLKRKVGRPRKVHPPNSIKLESSLDNANQTQFQDTLGTDTDFDFTLMDVSYSGNGPDDPPIKRPRGRPRKVPNSEMVQVDESHENGIRTRYQGKFGTSDNETSECDAGMNLTDAESDPNYRDDGRSGSG